MFTNIRKNLEERSQFYFCVGSLKTCTMKYLIFFVVILLYTWKTKSHHQLVVDTPLGKVRGSILTTRLGKDIYSFRSIRYAKAPINKLRFQPPVPVDKWNDIYDATQPGPVCPQPNNQNSSEDCLMLNVYVNKLPRKHSNLNRPVMLFFHPGGFYGFTGASYMFGPQYLLDQDIVLVTANYRLGSLGFLSTGTKEAPGNNGFKDQVVVLKWVRDNIRAFGGNPDMVTLSGHSAGGLSNGLHMISPMSRGLFHRVILMSSTPFGQGDVTPDQYSLAQKQARLVNCTDDTPVNIINCLNTKSAQEIVDTLPGFAEVGPDPILIWTVVIEPDFGQERFITEHPITSMLYGRYAKIPVMLGITENEFGYVSYNAINFPSFLDLLTNDYKRVLPIILGYERDTERSNQISTAIKRFYFGDGKVDNTSREGIHNMYADAIPSFGVNRAVKLISEKSDENTYYYCFTYKGQYSFYYLPGSNNTQTVGPVHHDELMYLFYMSTLFPYINKEDPEWKTVDKMVKMWTDFVKTGNPTPEPSALLNNVKWIPYKKNNPKYLDIGDTMIVKENLFEDRYQMWEKQFPLSNYA